MKRGSLYRDDQLLVMRLAVASGMGERMRGLLGCRRLPPGDGLLIARCGSIHTFFMRFTIDVVFLDSDMCVLKAAANVTPFRMVFGGVPAGFTLEVQSGWMDTTVLRKGDRLRLHLLP